MRRVYFETTALELILFLINNRNRLPSAPIIKNVHIVATNLKCGGFTRLRIPLEYPARHVVRLVSGNHPVSLIFDVISSPREIEVSGI